MSIITGCISKNVRSFLNLSLLIESYTLVKSIAVTIMFFYSLSLVASAMRRGGERGQPVHRTGAWRAKGGQSFLVVP